MRMKKSVYAHVEPVSATVWVIVTLAVAIIGAIAAITAAYINKDKVDPDPSIKYANEAHFRFDPSLNGSQSIHEYVKASGAGYVEMWLRQDTGPAMDYYTYKYNKNNVNIFDYNCYYVTAKKQGTNYYQPQAPYFALVNGYYSNRYDFDIYLKRNNVLDIVIQKITGYETSSSLTVQVGYK